MSEYVLIVAFLTSEKRGQTAFRTTFSIVLLNSVTGSKLNLLSTVLVFSESLGNQLWFSQQGLNVQLKTNNRLSATMEATHTRIRTRNGLLSQLTYVRTQNSCTT